MTPNASPTPVNFSALGRRAHPPTIARLMTMALETPGLLSLAAGFTDNRTLPAREVEEVVKELTETATDLETLQYGTNQGRPGLRRVLAERIHHSEPALSIENLADSMIITNGSQQALYLAIQVLCDPGDIVLVDRPTYFVFLEMLQGLGVEARSIPVDHSGAVDGAALGELLDGWIARGEARKLRAIYLVSYFSNPSSRSLNAGEKERIAMELAQRGLTLPVIEDAAYRELYFRHSDSTPSVLSSPAWERFPRLYTSTLTKPFATGLKIGYAVCTDREWLNKMLYAKGHHDFGSANFNQAVFEGVLRNGGFERQLERIRPAYEAKRDALHHTLVEAGLTELGWSWSKPEGGLYLWIRCPEDLDTSLEADFCRECVAHGVVYVPGNLCFGDAAPKNFIRLSFGVLSPSDLQRAGHRLVEVARRHRSLASGRT